MKVYTLFLIVLLSVLYHAQAKIYTPNQVKSLFTSFSKKFKKAYTGSVLAKKLAAFENNIEYIANFNAKSKKGKLAVNKFAAYSLEEFQKKYLGDAPIMGKTLPSKNTYRSTVRSDGNTTLPDSVDWSNLMPPIQDQGSCGSCWAFAATAVFEGHNAIRTKKIVKYSEQYLVDCASTHPEYSENGNSISGCGGGVCFNVYNFITKTGGLCTEEEYGTYKSKQGECKTCTKSGLIGDWMSTMEEDKIKAEVAKGPVYGRINASSLYMMFLGAEKDGWFEEESCIGKSPNHAVVIVGYGTDPALGDYWLIRNSWGKDWGKDGFLRLKRGVKMCGVNQYPGFFKPVTEDPAPVDPAATN